MKRKGKVWKERGNGGKKGGKRWKGRESGEKRGKGVEGKGKGLKGRGHLVMKKPNMFPD